MGKIKLTPFQTECFLDLQTDYERSEFVEFIRKYSSVVINIDKDLQHYFWVFAFKVNRETALRFLKKSKNFRNCGGKLLEFIEKYYSHVSEHFCESSQRMFWDLAFGYTLSSSIRYLDLISDPKYQKRPSYCYKTYKRRSRKKKKEKVLL